MELKEAGALEDRVLNLEKWRDAYVAQANAERETDRLVDDAVAKIVGIDPHEVRQIRKSVRPPRQSLVDRMEQVERKSRTSQRNWTRLLQILGAIAASLAVIGAAAQQGCQYGRANPAPATTADAGP